jgi:hypothetical protein
MSVNIETYSDKSFVVRGDTREHKESLKAMGGKWNSRLTEKSSGEMFGAWIFWSDKRDLVKSWIAKGCPEVAGSTSTHTSPTHGSSGGNTSRLEAKIDHLTRMVQTLCAANGVAVISKPQTVDTTSDDVIVEDDEQPSSPPKRLLAKPVAARRTIGK